MGSRFFVGRSEVKEIFYSEKAEKSPQFSRHGHCTNIGGSAEKCDAADRWDRIRRSKK